MVIDAIERIDLSQMDQSQEEEEEEAVIVKTESLWNIYPLRSLTRFLSAQFHLVFHSG